MHVSALWMRSTVIYNNNIFSAHISLLFTASFPAYLLIYFTAQHSAVSQATIFSIVTKDTVETCDKQWPLVQAWDQRLPHQKETLHSAESKWIDQFGSQPFLSLSLSVCVRSVLAMISLTILLYVFVQWNKAVGQCCIVLCARVCESVSFTGSVVLLFGLIVIRWDKEAAKYGKCQTGQWGRNVYLYFLLLWSIPIEFFSSV